MKRKTIISTLFFLLLALWPVGASSGDNNLVLTYSQKTCSRDLEVRLNSPNIAYRMTIRQNLDGSFTLLSPPFLCAEIDRLRIGELNDIGLLSLMLDPMGASTDNEAFRKGRIFSRIGSPSLNPKLSGAALNLENLNLFAFSPVLNPRSPSGFGLIAGNSEVFAGILFATQNRILVRQSADRMQVNWRQLGIGKNMIFSLIGAAGSARLLGIDIRSRIFLQNAFDTLLGGGTTLGWSLEAQTNLLPFTINLSHRIGGFGVKLKRLTDDSSPKDSFRAAFRAESTEIKDLGMEIEYVSDTYELPVYGGSSQKRRLYYNLQAFWRKNSLKIRNSTSFDQDRGKVQQTEYIVVIKELGAELEASFILNRPLGSPSFTSGGRLKFKADHATLEVDDKKVLLTMGWSVRRDGYELEFSIDQDRRVTASLSFRGL